MKLIVNNENILGKMIGPSCYISIIKQIVNNLNSAIKPCILTGQLKNKIHLHAAYKKYKKKYIPPTKVHTY